jgi:hypothetical protein
MPEPLTSMAMLCGLHVASTCLFAVIGYYAQQPSTVHNNTIVYNDTYVKNITHTHIFNEYHIKNSTVSITMLDGSSCVIADILRGIPRTTCPENRDNPLAIAELNALATGLNDTVTGVHVTIGSVSTSVHEIQAKSDKIMEVLNSVRVMQSDTFPTILRLELEKQALQFKVDRKEEVDRLTQESTNQKTEIKRLTLEYTNQKAEIERLARESTSQKAEIERLTLAQISTDNKCQTPVPPVAAFKASWYYYVFLSLLLVLDVFTHQSCDDSKNRLRKYFKEYTDAVLETMKRNKTLIVQKKKGKSFLQVALVLKE